MGRRQHGAVSGGSPSAVVSFGRDEHTGSSPVSATTRRKDPKGTTIRVRRLARSLQVVVARGSGPVTSATQV